MDNYLVCLSENLLLDVKLGKDSKLLRRELYFLKENKFHSFLNTDELKKSFWTNIYNAYILILVSEKVKNNIAFDFKRIKVAKNLMSLDDIEHKILRMGDHNGIYTFINKIFYSDFIKNAAIKNVDFKQKLLLNKSALYDLESSEHN